MSNTNNSSNWKPFYAFIRPQNLAVQQGKNIALGVLIPTLKRAQPYNSRCAPTCRDSTLARMTEFFAIKSNSGTHGRGIFPCDPGRVFFSETGKAGGNLGSCERQLRKVRSKETKLGITLDYRRSYSSAATPTADEAAIGGTTPTAQDAASSTSVREKQKRDCIFVHQQDGRCHAHNPETSCVSVMGRRLRERPIRGFPRELPRGGRTPQLSSTSCSAEEGRCANRHTKDSEVPTSSRG